MATFEWSDREFVSRVVIPSANAALEVVGEQLASIMRSNMGSEGGGVVGKTRTGRNIYAPAPPGAFPGVRRGGGGGLLSAIGTTRAVGLSIRVGAARRAPHGYWLETGTSRMAARPWLVRSFVQSRATLSGTFNRSLRREYAARVVGGAA